jgi:hypothetical protein
MYDHVYTYTYIEYLSVSALRLTGYIEGMGTRCKQGFSGETWGKENNWKTQA